MRVTPWFKVPEPQSYRADFYTESDKAPEDILLVIEVAETSERYERRTKAPLYSRSVYHMDNA